MGIRQQVVSAYTKGATMKEVAVMMSLSPATVSKIVKECNAQRTGSRLDEYKAEIKAMAKAGKSRTEIGNKFGCAAQTIKDYCVRNRIKLIDVRQDKSKVQRMLDEDALLIEAIAPDLTSAEIAEKWEVDLVVMRNWLRTRHISCKRARIDNGRKKIQIEKHLIVKALNDNAGRMESSAVALGISRSTLERLMRENNIKRISEQ